MIHMVIEGFRTTGSPELMEVDFLFYKLPFTTELCHEIDVISKNF